MQVPHLRCMECMSQVTSYVGVRVWVQVGLSIPSAEGQKFSGALQMEELNISRAQITRCHQEYTKRTESLTSIVHAYVYPDVHQVLEYRNDYALINVDERERCLL